MEAEFEIPRELLQDADRALVWFLQLRRPHTVAIQWMSAEVDNPCQRRAISQYKTSTSTIISNAR